MYIMTNNKIKKLLITILLSGCITAFAQSNNQQTQDKTKEQVDTIIKQAGSTNPDWWNSVELKYPATLDMNWPIQEGAWDGRGGMAGFSSTQVSEIPSRQAGLSAIETLEKQVASLRTLIEKAPSVDPNIAGLEGAELTEFMNEFASETNTLNQIQQTLAILTGTAITTNNTTGITTATLNELIALANQDKATKLTAHLEAMAKQIQANTRGGIGTPGGIGGERGARGERGAGTRQIPANIDQYLIQVIYQNPAQHKLGIKLVSKFASMHNNKFEKYKRDINTLAYMYYDLVFDYARAAYWWQRYAELGGSADTLKLARCYYELGSKSAAADILTKAGSNTSNAPRPGNNNRDIIKLWATIGEVDKALSMIESGTTAAPEGERGIQGLPGGSNMQLQNNMMLAGEICRQAGKYDQAIAYYQKVLDAQPAGQNPQEARGGRGGEDGRSLKARATANIEALKLIKTLDLKKVPDGSYSGTGTGHEGTLTIKATVKAGKIESIEVTQQNETPNRYANAEKVARKIVSKQGIIGVDAVTGATETSDAIINGAAKALASSMK
jgi:uncharacterized protein with FMN-binding domain